MRGVLGQHRSVARELQVHGDRRLALHGNRVLDHAHVFPRRRGIWYWFGIRRVRVVDVEIFAVRSRRSSGPTRRTRCARSRRRAAPARRRRSRPSRARPGAPSSAATARSACGADRSSSSESRSGSACRSRPSCCCRCPPAACSGRSRAAAASAAAAASPRYAGAISSGVNRIGSRNALYSSRIAR